jgi:hypothetical protein
MPKNAVNRVSQRNGAAGPATRTSSRFGFHTEPARMPDIQ